MDNIFSLITTLAKSNTINFVLMVVILYIIVKKMNLNSSLNKSIENVENSIRQSEQEKLTSQNTLKKAQETMDKLPKQIEDIKKFNEQKTEVFKNQLENASKKSIENLKLGVKKAVLIEEKRISNEITSETVSSSIAQSKENIIKMLKEKPELHYKFIEKSLEQLDRIRL